MRWEHGTEAGALVGTPNVEGRGEDVLRLSPETCRGLVSWRSADWTGRTYDVYLRNVRTARGVVRKLFFFFFCPGVHAGGEGKGGRASWFPVAAAVMSSSL